MLSSKIEVLWVARYDYKPGWGLKNHSHDYYQIIYILGGSGEFCLDQTQHKLTSDQLFLIQPNCIHGLHLAENSAIKTLDIKFRVHDSALKKELSTLSGLFHCTDQNFKILIENIRQEGLGRKYNYKEFSNIYLYEMLLKLIRMQIDTAPSFTKSSEPDPLNTTDTISAKTKEYIKKNFDKPLSLEEIATVLGYNKNYLCDQFKRDFQYSPIKYLYRYRIKMAKELIKYSDYSLKEIAAMIGFENVHHFTRVFCQHENITPGQWRDNEKNGVRQDIYISENFKNENMTQRMK